MSSSFTCKVCSAEFTVPEAALRKYPGWTPSKCLNCRDAGKKGGSSRNSSRSGSTRRGGGGVELNLTVDEVLARYSDGPVTGVFTDGSAQPNPGPGGWGAVYVVNDEVIEQRYGNEPHTTNNRMELMALIEAFKMLPEDVEVDVWTDSQLCVNTVTQWAAGWEKRGWKRKGGPIKNLELVQELYALAKSRPKVELRWIKAHSGLRWNEYADSLSTAYTRDSL